MGKKIKPKHNGTKTILFNRWRSMINRCKPGWNDSKFYYDKGIKVCDEWSLFVNFRDWALNNGYDERLELDRKENDIGYCPENCRWISKFKNILNRDITIKVNYEGKVIPLAELNILLGWDKKTYRNIRDRVARGWSIKDAIEKPLQNR